MRLASASSWRILSRPSGKPFPPVVIAAFVPAQDRAARHLSIRQILAAGDKTSLEYAQSGAVQMASYKLATYRTDAGARASVMTDERMLEDWDAAQDAIEATLARGGAAPRPLAGTKLLAPVLWPSAIYCAGANYG